MFPKHPSVAFLAIVLQREIDHHSVQRNAFTQVNGSRCLKFEAATHVCFKAHRTRLGVNNNFIFICYKRHRPHAGLLVQVFKT